MLEPKMFVGCEGINKEDYIIGIYLLEAESEDILKKVEAIAFK